MEAFLSKVGYEEGYIGSFPYREAFA